jgi:uncharacterized membrane protein YhhN
MPRRSSRVALACFGAVAAVDLVAELSGWAATALVCRVLLMPLLAWCCWTGAARRTRLVIMVLIALGFSWLGDLSATVLIKIGFFLIAQIVYIMAFRPSWRWSLITRPPLAIAYAVVLAALIGVVSVAAGPLAGPVAVYGASLAVMAMLATGVGRLTGIVLAVELFVAPGAIPYALFVNMALYLPAQLMIILGVLERVDAEVESTVADPVA